MRLCQQSLSHKPRSNRHVYMMWKELLVRCRFFSATASQAVVSSSNYEGQFDSLTVRAWGELRKHNALCRQVNVSAGKTNQEMCHLGCRLYLQNQLKQCLCLNWHLSKCWGSGVRQNWVWILAPLFTDYVI